MAGRSKIASVIESNSFLGDAGPTESSLLSSVLPFVMLIIIAPITIFFICRSYIFSGVFGLTDNMANVWAAAVAVLLVHIILGMFVYRAVKSEEKKGDKMD